jgi:hypothetical protein
MQGIDYQALYRSGFAIVQMDDLDGHQRTFDTVGVIMPISALTLDQVRALDDPTVMKEYHKGMRDEIELVRTTEED